MGEVKCPECGSEDVIYGYCDLCDYEHYTCDDCRHTWFED